MFRVDRDCGSLVQRQIRLLNSPIIPHAHSLLTAIKIRPFALPHHKNLNQDPTRTRKSLTDKRTNVRGNGVRVLTGPAK